MLSSGVSSAKAGATTADASTASAAMAQSGDGWPGQLLCLKTETGLETGGHRDR